MQITTDILKKIAPTANLTIITDLAKCLVPIFEKYQINTQLRVINFLAQAAHESAGFRTLTEYASGAEYEGRKDLGNVQHGDGEKYKGRGIFQITGRRNYDQYGKEIGIDLINNPNLAATEPNSAMLACVYWNDHNLNEKADRDDIVKITKSINGGENGLADRQLYHARTKAVIGQIFAVASSIPVVVSANVTSERVITQPTFTNAPRVSTTETDVDHVEPSMIEKVAAFSPAEFLMNLVKSF